MIKLLCEIKLLKKLFIPFMFFLFVCHAILKYTYLHLDLSIANCNVLAKSRWCAAGDPVRYFFSNDFEGNKQKTKHEMDLG